MIPILILSVGAVILIEFLCTRAIGETGLSLLAVRAIMAGLILLAVLVAAALALQAGDRFTRPVVWLLRALDTGQIRLLSQLPPPAADWEMAALCDRVRVLLRQNLSGAKSVRELEAFRAEIESVLDSAEANKLALDQWSQKRSKDSLTRRLLGFFEAREERVREAAEGLARLQSLLEQDWREETLTIEQIVKKAESCFLQQTQLAVELERLERSLNTAPEQSSTWREAEGLLNDLRLGIESWRREIEEALSQSAVCVGQGALTGMAADQPGPSTTAHETDRLRNWNSWVQESLGMLETSLSNARKRVDCSGGRIAGGLEKLSAQVAGTSREVSALSREVARLQGAWARLGERLRTLMVRAGEVHGGPWGVEAIQGEESDSGSSQQSGNAR